MAREHILSIGVVGAGMAGAAAATLLARAGHRITRFERVADPAPASRFPTSRRFGHVRYRMVRTMAGVDRGLLRSPEAVTAMSPAGSTRAPDGS